ncbi:hypothetical protein B0E43_16435 [Algoriphagus sp. A40]|nr:hypothetical protein B0E43_16435 [Algoriphagus sp. A40]
MAFGDFEKGISLLSPMTFPIHSGLYPISDLPIIIIQYSCEFFVSAKKRRECSVFSVFCKKCQKRLFPKTCRFRDPSKIFKGCSTRIEKKKAVRK